MFDSYEIMELPEPPLIKWEEKNEPVSKRSAARGGSLPTKCS